MTREIVSRTDGVPLFVEELTKAVVESHTDAAPALQTVPATLRDTLMARLDRDPDGRQVAQIAAVIGREFSYDLLAMIAPVPTATLRDALNSLLQSELIFQHGLLPHTTYTFKHALVQDIAYESQLRRRRRALHGQIADTLRKHFTDTPPEVVAHHYAEAGEAEEAIVYFRHAAELARDRSANTEAAAHFARALQLLDTLPASVERDQLELDLHIARGAQLIAVLGNAADEVGQTYQRAIVLSQTLGASSQMFRALRGLQTYHIVRGELSRAHPIGERLIDEAERANSRDLLLQAHRPHGLCLLYMGELPAARHHLEQAITLYDPDAHAQHRFLYGSDPLVLAHCNLAWVDWFLGFPDRALSHSRAALEYSKQPEPHAHSQAFALSLAASLEQFRGEADEARTHAEAVIEIAEQQQFAYWGPWGRVIRGWAKILSDEFPAAINEIEQGHKAYRETKAGLMSPYFLGLQADALQHLGRLEEGLAIVDEALDLAENRLIRFYEPELLCTKAELLEGLRAPVDTRISILQQAAEIAARQSSRASELRALTLLARQKSGSSDAEPELLILREALAAFEGQQETKQMAEAKAVLESAGS